MNVKIKAQQMLAIIDYFIDVLDSQDLSILYICVAIMTLLHLGY